MKSGRPIQVFAVCFATVLLLVLGIDSCAKGLTQMRLELGSSANAVHVQAVVAGRDHHVHTGTSRTGGSSSLTVLYEYEGKTVQNTLWCTEQTYESHEVGSTVEVVYDPASPSTIMLADGLGASTGGYLAIGILCVVGAIAVPCVYVVFARRGAVA